MDIIFDIDFYCKTANRSRQNRSKEQKELIKEMIIFCKDNLSGLSLKELFEKIAYCAKEEILKWYPWNVNNEDAIAVNIGFYSEAVVMAGLFPDFDTLFKESFKYYTEYIAILDSEDTQFEDTFEDDW